MDAIYLTGVFGVILVAYFIASALLCEWVTLSSTVMLLVGLVLALGQ